MFLFLLPERKFTMRRVWSERGSVSFLHSDPHVQYANKIMWVRLKYNIYCDMCKIYNG